MVERGVSSYVEDLQAPILVGDGHDLIRRPSKGPGHSFTGGLLESGKGESMTNLGGVVKRLREEHDRLSKELKAVGAALSAFGAAYRKGTAPRSRMSAAGRARIAAAQRARWVKVKAESRDAKIVPMPKKRTMSASARRRIAAAQRARWAKVKAAKKTA